MTARWKNVTHKNRYATIAGRAANWPRGQSRLWKGHIVILSGRFLILPIPSQHIASRIQMRQWKGSLTDQTCCFVFL